MVKTDYSLGISKIWRTLSLFQHRQLQIGRKTGLVVSGGFAWFKMINLLTSSQSNNLIEPLSTKDEKPYWNEIFIV